MNNAWSQEEEVKPDTQVEQARLTRLIEAISGLFENRDWQTLNELHLSKEKERVERLLFNEALKPEPSVSTIQRLQGELIWARRYADLPKFVVFLKNQLNQLKYGK